MKRLIYVICILLFVISSRAQKPLIDSTVYGKWPGVGEEMPKISNDGKYCLFAIENLPVGSMTLIIRKTDGSWVKEIPSVYATNVTFTSDSRSALWMQGKDSLAILQLGTDSIEWILQTRSFKLTKGNEGGQWLAYQPVIPGEKLILRNLINGKKETYDSVIDFLFREDGEILVVQTDILFGEQHLHFMYWVDLKADRKSMIWEGQTAGGYTFDCSGARLAFCVRDKVDSNRMRNSIWLFEEGSDKAKKLIDDQSRGIQRGWSVQFGRVFFDQAKGNKLFFSLSPPPDSAKLAYTLNESSVDVWNYKENRLQSRQLEMSKNGSSSQTDFLAVTNLQVKKVVSLNREFERVVDGSYSDIDDAVLVGTETYGIDGYSNPNGFPSYSLISTTTGARCSLIGNPDYNLYFSPHGKYILYWDIDKRHYIIYNRSTGLYSFPGHEISNILQDHTGGSPLINSFGFASWHPDDKSFLVYDQYDIWQLDPESILPPVNITRSYGRLHHLILRMFDRDFKYSGDRTLLWALDAITKKNGFYDIQLGTKKPPRLLSMGNYVYHLGYRSEGMEWVQSPFRPVMARDNAVYIVKRQSANEAPNFYSTTDFKQFTSLSDLKPQIKYNWLTSQLITWKLSDGGIGQGILYKPENFDPQKKYPVIFYFYEQLSDGLNLFITPDWSIGTIDIPTYVSKGYLVFAPDIYYEVGEPSRAIVNSITAAAKCLLKFPWVDSTRLAMNGHSFGGYDVNCLLTHSNIFAAAAESAGPSDMVSDYGSVGFGGRSMQKTCETGQMRLGATLWQMPDRYIDNSPVFRIGHVSTPLLIMHNKEDDAVSVFQGLELFTGLRRLGKKVWMLQYDGSGHAVDGEDARKDFTIRLDQFFGYYLKGEPPPRWMTLGVPPKYKGYFSATDLDLSSSNP